MARLWLSLHFILRAYIKIPSGYKLDQAWGYWVGRWLRNGDITVTSTCSHEEDLSGTERPLVPKYPQLIIFPF